ncbi:MAG: thiolase family protein, partial [Betaproteobacteria bacterium]|nr:thiolase family protein [Betaproteobacteria bacterium]
DAGIDLQDIDGLICQRITDYQKFVQITNISPRLVTATPGAGRMTGGTIQMAVQAILSGMLNTVGVVYGNDGRSAGAKYGGKGDTYGTGADQMWFPYGMTSPGAVHSMLFQRHANLYGTKIEQLGEVSMAFRKHAMLNPNAVMRKPMTMDDYLASRYICEPLRLLDYCLINDGGVAMIMTLSDRARDLRQTPVHLAAFAQRSQFVDSTFPPEDFWREPMAQAGAETFAKAGISHADVDALMVYDNFSPTVMFSLEGFGYCPVGESGAFVQGGTLKLGGQYPTNTSGGHLSESYMQGWALNVEAVRQLRGNCGERQVPDAEFVHYMAAAPVISSILYTTHER